jgi:hypothetical protein
MQGARPLLSRLDWQVARPISQRFDCFVEGLAGGLDEFFFAEMTGLLGNDLKTVD